MVKVTEETTKQRRKKTTSTSSESAKPEMDVYSQVVAYEENEALSRSPDKDAALYCKTCANIRQILLEIEKLKSRTDIPPEAIQASIAEKRTQVSLQFVLLKKLNRYEKIRTKASRDALHKEKQCVDTTQLQLHNLLYELEHLKKEITKCLQFKSKDEEIELISVEEFYREAPESITRPDVTKSDKHQLRLARLEWELRQRKELSEACRKLETGKSEVAAQIISKQERLDGLAPRLNQILEVTKPLKDYFGIDLGLNEVAYLLPDPLFLLYYQVEAYQKVYDKTMTIEIKGDEEEARQLKDESEVVDSDSESDEENEGHRRKSSKVDRMEIKRKQLLSKHPLSVIITFMESNISITFYYLTHLHIVTTKCEVSPVVGVTAGDVLDSILYEVFEGDTGEDSPNIANHYQLRQVGLDKFPFLVGDLGHPYVWAQRICGLEFLETGKPGQVRKELSQSNVEVVIKVIQSRFQARLALAKQIQAFEQNSLISISTEISKIEEYPAGNIQSKLEKWRRINYTDFIKYTASKQFVENSIFETTDLIYRVTISRNAAKLHAFVSIKSNYPEQKPIFSIMVDWCGEWTAQNSDALRDMERAVNVEWPEKSSKPFILGAQLHRLLIAFDIYLETQSSEFPQQKIFFKGIRGRNRSRPYKIVKGSIFTQ